MKKKIFYAAFIAFLMILHGSIVFAAQRDSEQRDSHCDEEQPICPIYALHHWIDAGIIHICPDYYDSHITYGWFADIIFRLIGMPCLINIHIPYCIISQCLIMRPWK